MKTTFLILVNLMFLVGLAACSAVNVRDTNSAIVNQAAAEVIDFDLPAGYQADFSITLMGYTLAAYNPGDGISHLYLLQSGNKKVGEKVRHALDNLVTGRRDRNTRMTIIETRAVTVRDQETTLVISENTNWAGVLYRQALVGFQGKGGPALLVFSEPAEGWDQTRLDRLLASIQ